MTHNVRQDQLNHRRREESAQARVPALPKREEVIVHSGHGLLLQLERETRVTDFAVRFQRRGLAISRKAERVVDVGVWVEVWITMDGVHGEADESTMRDVEPVAEANASGGGDLEGQS